MDPPKRGRGRPRKIKYQPEELLFTNNVEDLSDIPEAPKGEPEPRTEVEADEIIHMEGDGSHAEALVHEPVVEPEMKTPVKPTIVYLPAPVDTKADDAKVMMDEKARRNNALTKIKRYRENFEAVRAMKFNEDGPTEYLESHLEDIRIMISSKTSLMLVKSAYKMGVKGVEIATCSVGMKTYGLSDLLSKSKEIDDILKEIQCELGVGNLPAPARLAMATLSTVFVLDSINKRAEVLSTFKREAVNESITSKYGDL